MRFWMTQTKNAARQGCPLLIVVLREDNMAVALVEVENLRSVSTFNFLPYFFNSVAYFGEM